MKRKAYIDNLRWILIALLLPVHAALAFNSFGADHFILLDGENKGISTFYTLFSPWIMPTLFVLAGMVMRLSLAKRTPKEYVKRRLVRIGIPFLLGMFTIVAVLSFFTDVYNNGYVRNFTRHYKVFLLNFTDWTGLDGHFMLGHLWYLFYLLILGIVIVGILQLFKKQFEKLDCSKVGVLQVMALGILPIAGSLVPVIAGESVVQYLFLMLIGYLVLSEEAVLEKLVNSRFLLLFVALVALGVYTMLLVFLEQEGILVELARGIASWFGMLAVLALGRKYLDRTTIVRSHMTKLCLAFYWFHLLVVVWIQSVLQQFIDEAIPLFLLSVIASGLLTYLASELCTAVPFVRSLFGIHSDDMAIEDAESNSSENDDIESTETGGIGDKEVE